MYKLTQNGGITKDGTSLPAQWVNGALVELDEYSPFVIELREWIAQGNTPEAADQPSHNAQITAQIQAIEQPHQITIRDYRETKLAIALKSGLPAAWLDPAQPDPATSTDPVVMAQWAPIGFGLQIAVSEERAIKVLRAQLTL